MIKTAFVPDFVKTTILLILSIVVIFSYFYFTSDTVSANPDYICIKNVNRSCKITSCGAWRTDHTRVCTGTKVTQVGYFLRRTNCEAGYRKVYHGQSLWSSGRQRGNYATRTASCSILQSDYVSPTGTTSSN